MKKHNKDLFMFAVGTNEQFPIELNEWKFFSLSIFINKKEVSFNLEFGYRETKKYLNAF